LSVEKLYPKTQGEKLVSLLKIQRIIYFPQFLLSQPQIPSGDGGVGMIEEFSKFYERHLAVLPGHLHNLATKGFAEAMG